MYNRYVFDADGSCRRNQLPEAVPHEEKIKQSAQSEKKIPVHPFPSGRSPLDFLRQMLPAGFDNGDLIIILLLLLMAGDSREDHDNALLTLALYFIL